MLIYTKQGWENWLIEYLNKRRLGMTLLPWQQNICDSHMCFILDHPYMYAKFHSNLTCIIWEIDHLNFDKTGFLIIWHHKFCWTCKFFFLQIMLIWPSLNNYNSGMRRDIAKQLTLISMVSSISPKRLELRPSNFLTFSFYVLDVRKNINMLFLDFTCYYGNHSVESALTKIIKITKLCNFFSHLY